MRVYAVIACELYESDELVGIYSSIEAARAARDALAEQEIDFHNFDTYRIREMEVDAPAAVESYADR